MAKHSEDELNDALNAGFDDEHESLNSQGTSEPQDIPESNELETPPEAQVQDDAEPAEQLSAEPEAPVVDEWADIPDIIKNKFDKMGADLAKATNDARAASGRAAKLQNQVQQSIYSAVPETSSNSPSLTKDQYLAAMTDKAKRESLREDWAPFVDAIDEMDNHYTKSINEAMGNLRNEIAQDNNSALQDLQVKRTLDMQHPGWENTVANEDFKDWVFKDGPTAQERSHYEYSLTQASNAVPEQQSQLAQDAQNYYANLLNLHPAWAEDRGNLYGDPSGDAAIHLLDLHKEFKSAKIPNITSPAAQDTQALHTRNQRKLEDNITPTSGSGIPNHSNGTEDVNKAFLDGFNSSGYN